MVVGEGVPMLRTFVCPAFSTFGVDVSPLRERTFGFAGGWEGEEEEEEESGFGAADWPSGAIFDVPVDRFAIVTGGCCC